MASDGSTTEKTQTWRELFEDLSKSEQKFARGEDIRERPRLLRRNLKEARDLGKDLTAATKLAERLSAIRGLTEFDRIAHQVPLENRTAQNKVQKAYYRNAIQDAEAALGSMDRVMTSRSYRSIWDDHQMRVRTRGKLPADQVVIYLEKRRKELSRELPKILGPTDHKIARTMLENYSQARGVYKEVQRELISQIEKEDKAQQRREGRERAREKEGPSR